MSKILFFDIDGTLVGFDGKMSESTCLALNKAKENGHKIFLCTGRSLNQIYDFLLSFGFDGIVAAAGGYVEYQGEIVSNDVFGEALVKEVMDKAKESGAALMIQNKKASITTNDWAKIFAGVFSKQLGEKTLTENPTFANTYMDDDVDGYHKKYPDMESIIYCQSKYTVEEMGELMPDVLEVTPSSFKDPDPYSGEITLKHINKATGMQHVLDALHANREDAIGFGDGANDIDMLKFAGVGVAMGNSQDCALEAADMITDDIADDGLYNAMVKLELI